MHDLIDFKAPTKVIAHFKQDELRSVQVNLRIIYYQITIGVWPDSPSSEFVRLESKSSEIHGWVRADDLIIDEVLEEVSEEDLKEMRNG